MGVLITVGAGLSRPQGKRVEVADVEQLASALGEANPAPEAWWSPHTWRGDARDSEAWEGATGIGVDVDTEGHVPLPDAVAVELERYAKSGGVSGSIFHRTPAGARFIFAFATPCTDQALFQAAAKGAAQAVAFDLRELGLDSCGLTVDPKPHIDMARLYFTPKAFAKGVRRDADVVVMRRAPYDAQELARSFIPTIPAARPVEQPKVDPARRATAYVAGMGPSIEGARGDDHAFKVAATLVNDFALPESEAWRLFCDWNTTCQPPWSERDLQRFIKSAQKNGKHPAGAKLLEDRPAAPKATAQAGPTPTNAIKLVRACDVEDEQVEWLIPGFIARGELTDLAGDPGVGKGGLLASWAARVTTTSDERVILFSTEDRLGHVKARLRSEGADLARVLLLDIREANTSPVLPADILAVEDIVRSERAALVAFDPALEFMAAQLDSHRQQDVQQFAASLGGMAQRTRASVMTVRHLNKAQNVAAIYKAAGSIAFIARARMALLAAKDKENGRRVLSVIKGNIGKDTSAVEFDIVEKDGSTVVAWGETSTRSADELVNQDPKKARHGPQPAKLEAACDLLRSMLAAGPMKIDDVMRCARAERVGRTTVYDAKRALRLQPCTLEMASAWRLP